MEIPYQIHVHHQKKLKDYIFDFFMLFTAVTTGFFVENKRDHYIEGVREKQYIRSLINDLREDTVKVNQMIFWNNYIVPGLDTLARMLQDYRPGDTAAARSLYNWYMSSARSSYSVKFTDRTLATLKSSGNIRIIHSQEIQDSILRYEEDVRIAMAQDGTYKDFWMRSLDLSCNIFDYKYIRYKRDSATNTYNYEPQLSYKLLNEDPETLRKYANLLELWKQVTFTYVLNIYAAKMRAISLIPFLKKEYDID